MRHKFIALLLMLGFASALVACSNSDDANAPTLFDPLVHSWPHDISDIPYDPSVTYGRLDNGMRYILQKNATPKDKGALRFYVLAGSKHETEQTLGLAHFLEHMAFNGSENVTEGEMVRSLERLGLKFGADTNASTTFSRTQYTLNLPKVDDETVDYALFLMRETADKLTINASAVDRERSVIIAEEARNNIPRRKARRAYNSFMYPDLLSTQRPVIGRPETLATITPENLRDFYETYYRPERTILIFAGDRDVAEMEQKIQTVFGDWSNEIPVPEEPSMGEISRRDVTVKIHDDDELSTRVSLLDARESTYVGDGREARKANYIRSYANAIVNQRIRKILLSSGAPVRRANIGYSSRKTGDTRTAYAAAKNDDWQAALTLLDTEIRKALLHGFQDVEYDELIANTRRNLTDSVNYAPKRKSRSLADGAINNFSSAVVRTTPSQRLKYFEHHAATVTPEHLHTAFKEMWSDFDPAIWIEGPKLEDVTESDVIRVLEMSRLVEPGAPEIRQKLRFAYQDFGTPGKIISETRIEDFGIDQIIFSNNVRLNLKKTDFEEKWINMRVTVGEGWNAFPKSDPAILPLANAFALGGYEAHKASELSEIFAGKNVGVNMRIGSERLLFVGSTNPSDVEDQLKAWTALLTAPGYRPEWKEKFLDGIKASFHTIDSTPRGVAARDLGRIWTNGDRRFGYVEQSEYEAVTIEDVRSVLAPILRDGAIEIGIVGDFDKDAIIAAVAKTYGALPIRRAFFDPYPEAYELDFPEPERVTLTHTGADNLGEIYLTWPTTQEWSVPATRHYSLLQAIFNNRMKEIIREDMGLSYSPRASLRFDKNNVDYGYMTASMSGDPKHFEAFETAVKGIAANLRKGGITQDEVDRARKPLIERYNRALTENSDWVRLITESQTKPEVLEWRRTRTSAYEAMTPESLDAAAKDLFDPETLHIVMIKPQQDTDTSN